MWDTFRLMVLGLGAYGFGACGFRGFGIDSLRSGASNFPAAGLVHQLILLCGRDHLRQGV